MNNEEEKRFDEEEYPTEKIKSQDLINYLTKMKGHELLNSLVVILLFILIIDFFWNDKKLLEKILEIFKILIFTLSGYLFCKNEKE